MHISFLCSILCSLLTLAASSPPLERDESLIQLKFVSDSKYYGENKQDLVSQAAYWNLNGNPQKAVDILVQRKEEQDGQLSILEWIHLGQAQCTLGEVHDAVSSFRKALGPYRGGSLGVGYLHEVLPRIKPKTDFSCNPLPLLYPIQSVVYDVLEGDLGRAERHYHVERYDGTKVVVKQRVGEGGEREAYVLRELHGSQGDPDEEEVMDDFVDTGLGSSPFPAIYGNLSGLIGNNDVWTACIVQYRDGMPLNTEEGLAYLTAMDKTTSHLMDLLFLAVDRLYNRGIEHRAISPSEIMILRHVDTPAFVSFSHAVALGMPYEEPLLHPEAKHPPEGGYSDLYSLASTFKGLLGGINLQLDGVLDSLLTPKPHERDTYMNNVRGNVAFALDQAPPGWEKYMKPLNDAWGSYRNGLKVAPYSGVPANNLGSVFFDRGMLDEALRLFEEALPKELPFKSGVASNMMAVRKMTAQWDYYDADMKMVVDLVAQGGEEVRSIRNLYALAFPLPLDQHRKISEAGAAFAHKQARQGPDGSIGTAVMPVLHPPPEIFPGDKLRIAYVSSDILTQHAVAGSVRWVLRLHDPTKFIITIYGYTDTQRDAAMFPERSGLVHWKFVDTQDDKWQQRAEKINADGNHIMIDLNGQTGLIDNMPVLSYKPCPIAMHYLGFPSTVGANYIDYLIGDRIVSPPEMQHGYVEKLLMLSSTFQVVSYKQSHPHPWPEGRDGSEDIPLSTGRRFWGMPGQGQLMCNWNQHFKLDPGLFSAWGGILSRAPESKLVMLRYPPESERHLRKEGRKRGITIDKFYLLPKADLPKHMIRTTYCDLFLDNREYNAGTTCTDALWGGVPLVALPREKHSSRHSASMLSAVGGKAANLIARSLQDYEDLVVRVLTKPGALEATRQSVLQSWETSSLFDTWRWTREVEAGLRIMWEHQVQGIKLGHIIITPRDRRRDGGPFEKEWLEKEAKK